LIKEEAGDDDDVAVGGGGGDGDGFKDFDVLDFGIR
jgi:hypothetical protein